MSSSERLLVYPRMLIKLSGEALAGETGFGVDNDLLDQVSEQINSVTSLGVQVGVVIRGGNFFRGA
ncbi:MAG: hypothetical protein QF536_01330 [Arenicellales bacterium]|nr:hypothetical protein [Arenicellales bacterium]MDP6672279.1 hypothetical protein [Arenicellales bacterium]MDP6723825.1 hypothetical protein [Arenicellales bacterium]